MGVGTVLETRLQDASLKNMTCLMGFGTGSDGWGRILFGDTVHGDTVRYGAGDEHMQLGTVMDIGLVGTCHNVLRSAFQFIIISA